MCRAVLLAQHNDVCILDVDARRVAQIKRGQSTVDPLVADAIDWNKHALVMIKSTVPVGIGPVYSDNILLSSVLGILHRLLEAGVEAVICEPLSTDRTNPGVPWIAALANIKACADLIAAKRVDNQIGDIMHKLFSRDLFGTC